MGLCLLASCGDSTGATGGAGGVGGTSGAGGTGGIDLDVWSCTEQGIRDAITFGGGPHTFACNGPTVVTTEATIDIDNDVILDGEGNLIVDGNKSHRVFSVKRGIDAELLNLAATGGHAVFAGAGIYSEGDLLLDNCSVVENQSDDIAGGIYNLEGALEITNSTISRNEATAGGGIFSGGDVTIRDSTISRNTGGGIYSGGTLWLTRSTIGGNVGALGGGGIANSGDLIISGSTISANEALRGGGISNVGALLLFETTVEGNVAEEGGGIYSHDANRNVEGGDLSLSSLGLLDVQYSTISSNTAQRGAGIYSISLRMTAWNSTMSGNMASEEGGALYVGGTTLGASTIYLNANTIVDNTAARGSALLGTGETPTVRFSGNIMRGDCHASDSTVVWTSDGSNIESPGDTCDFTQPSDRVNITSGELNLAPLAENGGDTETHLPMTGSVAIDMIPAEQCGEVLPVFPLLDQRVVDRPQGMGCDVGSVEVVPEP
jgi:hypothetical protein